MPDDSTADTVGERLAGQVRALQARRGHTPGWLPAFELLRAHTALLPEPQTSARRRVEADVPPVADPLPGGGPAWPANQPATHIPDPTTRLPTDVHGIPAGHSPDPAAALPADVRQRLRSVVGAEVEHLAVHTDDRADDLAREHRADAVTVGHEIHFRTGRFRPAEPAGFALLAHEAWHATADQRGGGTTHRATDHGAATEEHHARAVERQALGGPAHPAPLAHRAAEPPTPTATRPMAAAEHRDLPPTPGEAPPALDLGALRAELLRDVLREVRTDLERGA